MDLQSQISGVEQRLAELEAERAELISQLEILQKPSPPKARSLPVITPSSAITNQSSPDEKLALFRRLFRGREDIYACRWENSKTGMSGYSPSCEGGWKSFKQNTADRIYLPLTYDEIRCHLRGEDPNEWHGRDFVVGIHPLLPDETCWF